MKELTLQGCAQIHSSHLHCACVRVGPLMDNEYGLQVGNTRQGNHRHHL